MVHNSSILYIIQEKTNKQYPPTNPSSVAVMMHYIDSKELKNTEQLHGKI